jgi:redox-sensitive bicupin YhaK (pirin superfamily)
MKKKISLTSQGQRADIGPYIIYRILGNRYVDAVGPFVFLDHAVPIKHSADEPLKKANGKGAHPHRGIATLTYILSGEAVHLDSRGHFAKVNSGGVQWMKAGNGIIHDEVVNVDARSGDLLTHALQFWINLPSRNKAEAPDYLPVMADEVPRKELENNSGWLKVIVGEYEELASKIPNYSKQFIYHVHLESKKSFSIDTEEGLEYAMFLPLNNATVNDAEYKKGEFLLFDKDEGAIEISNSSGFASDIILFGGEPYAESIVAQGPFVMNTQQEISEAYNDFYEGKYGEIDYSLAN